MPPVRYQLLIKIRSIFKLKQYIQIFVSHLLRAPSSRCSDAAPAVTPTAGRPSVGQGPDGPSLPAEQPAQRGPALTARLGANTAQTTCALKEPKKTTLPRDAV